MSYNADDSVTYYVYSMHGLISQETFHEGDDSEYRQFHFDYRGNTAVLTDESGMPVAHFDHPVYGDAQSGLSTETIFLFAGRYGVQTDGDGLYYMRARYYSPEMGRFISEDPYWHPGNMIYGDNPSSYPVPNIEAIEQSGNLYAYAMNKPVNRIDPLGLDSYILYDLYDENDTYNNFVTKFKAKLIARELELLYGTKCHIIPVSSGADLIDKWNNRVGFDSNGNAVSIAANWRLAVNGEETYRVDPLR